MAHATPQGTVSWTSGSSPQRRYRNSPRTRDLSGGRYSHQDPSSRNPKATYVTTYAAEHGSGNRGKPGNKGGIRTDKVRSHTGTRLADTQDGVAR